ncbi:hypothetical protein [Streptomyces sp. NPDC046385]|uniref:hypothetical protein n=1 Tax=Streptomyces sp. NPDC046385 TaxID=3154918 RepID=UPI0033E74A10
MQLPWRRRPGGRSRQLLDSAGVKPGSVDAADELEVCRQAACAAARRKNGTITAVLAVVEELLQDESSYEFALTFLEDLQNLSSHGLDTLRSASEIQALLGPRSAVCWDSLTGFWIEVANWRAGTGVPLQPIAPLLGVKNKQLRVLLLTSNRTLPTGEKLGLADAVRYEKAVGSPIPGYSHIAIALRSAEQD